MFLLDTQGGNTVVQDTVHDLLCTGDARALAVFQNMHTGLARCQTYVARKKYDTQAMVKTAEASMLDAKKCEARRACCCVPCTTNASSLSLFGSCFLCLRVRCEDRPLGGAGRGRGEARA